MSLKALLETGKGQPNPTTSGSTTGTEDFPMAVDHVRDADRVFRALADPTRRTLLDLLCEDNGQTLGQLCEHLDMARQSVTQHLGLLEDANLISTVRRGRESCTSSTRCRCMKSTSAGYASSSSSA